MALRLNRLWIVFALGIAIACVALYYVEKRRAAAAEAQLGLDASRTLTEIFGKARSLQVATLRGELLAKGSDPGWIDILTTTTTVKYPYTVDYFVDLSKVNGASYQWDAPNRTITVRIPDVRPAKPNIDGSEAKYLSTTGLWVTRSASQRMSIQAVKRAASRAAASATKPEHIRSVREAMQDLVTAPLRQANLGQVNVRVLLPGEIADGGNRPAG